MCALGSAGASGANSAVRVRNAGRPDGAAASLFPALAAMLLIAGACAGSESSDEGSGGSTGADEGASEPTHGGTLTYAITAETSGGWCLPEAQLVAPGVQVARAVYDQLTAPDENGEIAPFLAEEVVPNDTFDTWTIGLREGITFHDGSPLDAEVVKNNLDAYRGTYPNRSPLLFRFVLDNIASVEVVDDLTVEVRTTTPWPAFPWYLWNDGRMGIMSQTQLDDPETCDTDLVGTGPFVAGEWRINDSFPMTRNEDYWLTDDAGDQLPYLDGVVFRPVPEGATRINMLEAGEADVILAATSLDIDTLESLGDDIDLSIAERGNGVYYFQLNSGDGKIFDSRSARLAAAHAIDRDQIREVTDLDSVELASGPFAPGEMGYLDDAGYPEYDPERARELVEETERDQGRPFEVTLMTVVGASTAADQVQEMFETVGIEVNRQQYDDVGVHRPGPGGLVRPDAGGQPPGRRPGPAADLVALRLPGEPRPDRGPGARRAVGRGSGGDRPGPTHRDLREGEPALRRAGLQPVAVLQPLGGRERHRRARAARHAAARRHPGHPEPLGRALTWHRPGWMGRPDRRPGRPPRRWDPDPPDPRRRRTKQSSP